MNTNAKKWVEALRSGKYQQGQGALNTNGKLCCLGVACELSKGELNLRVEEDGGEVFYNGEGEVLPDPVAHWLGLAAWNGRYNGGCLAEKNDDGATFDEIASIIESEPKGLFNEDNQGHEGDAPGHYARHEYGWIPASEGHHPGSHKFNFVTYSYRVKPSTTKIKLNETYTAEVGPEETTVGCQTFKNETILKVAEAIRRGSSVDPRTLKRGDSVRIVSGDSEWTAVVSKLQNGLVYSENWTPKSSGRTVYCQGAWAFKENKFYLA